MKYGENMTTMRIINVPKLTNSSPFFKGLIVGLLLCTSTVAFCKPINNTVPKPTPILEFKSLTKNSKELKDINPRVLQLAMTAHKKASAMGLAQKSLMTIIDYSLPSTKRRMWVVDMNKGKVIYHTLVAHGSGSGGNEARSFSDKPGSLQSSLGLFVTGKTYEGKHGRSLVLHGLEQGINGNAERRRIVVHGAHYVNDHMAKNLGRLGRSWGCPALDTKLAQPIISTIKEGSLVFAYYPDDKWLKRSKFL